MLAVDLRPGALEARSGPEAGFWRLVGGVGAVFSRVSMNSQLGGLVGRIWF